MSRLTHLLIVCAVLLNSHALLAQYRPHADDAAKSKAIHSHSPISHAGSATQYGEGLFRQLERPAAATAAVPLYAAFFTMSAAEYDEFDSRRNVDVYLEKFELSPGYAVNLQLRTFNLLSADARVVAGTADGDVPIKHDRALFMAGAVEGHPGSFVYLSVFPEYTLGYVEFNDEAKGIHERYVIGPLDHTPGHQSVMAVCSEKYLDLDDHDHDDHFCTTNDEPMNEGRFEQLLTEYGGATHKRGSDKIQIDETPLDVPVAIECDNEYYNDHQQNISRTVNYSLSVMGACSAVYDRDLNVLLTVPYIRVWTTEDPFPGTNTSAGLSEVRSYWNANMGYVERALVHLFSGAFGGGRAYIGGLCNTVQYAVSGVNYLSTYPPTGYLYDIYLVSHETGHNFAANHTQNCFWNPPVDSCSLGGGGTSCLTAPNMRLGTVMSYCNPRRNHFHPRVSTYMRNYTEGRACVHPVADAYADDLEVRAMSFPANGGIYGSLASVTPTARFRNAGSNNQSNITVRYDIRESTTNTVVATSTQLINTLNAGAETDVVFSALSLATPGTYDGVATIELAGDENDLNNIYSRPFRIIPTLAGAVTLNYPNGGDTLCADTTINITWAVSGSISFVRIEWTPDDGETWYDVISKTDAGTGTYAWVVPTYTTDEARVRVMNWENSAVVDQSASTFSINGKYDAQPVEYTIPAPNTALHSPFRPTVSVRNNGTQMLSDVPLRVRIRHRVLNHDVYERTLTLSDLAPGESKTVVFPKATGFPIASGANYNEFSIFTTVLDDQDTNPWNDSLSRYFDISNDNPIVEAGNYHSMAILPSDGSVWAWGHNFYGQLGNAAYGARSRPVRMLNVSGAVELAGGAYTSYVLLNDGTVWSCGYGYYGQLGTGTVWDRNELEEISALSDITTIAAGRFHAFALESDGTVWAWGRNGDGQLGDGTTTQRDMPVQVNISDVVMLAAGESHTLALKADGTVWAWGANSNGQLGIPLLSGSNVPVQIPNLSSVRRIACGDKHSMALLADGTVRTWGWNLYGQLGDGSNTDRTAPVAVAGLSDIQTISAGRFHSTVLLDNATVEAFGRNDSGQLGDGTTSDRNTPVAAINISGVADLGGHGWHSLLVKQDGSVCASGYNYSGQIGNGTTLNTTQYSCQEAFASMTDNLFVDGGYLHSMGLRVSAGTVYTWGRNKFGQLGDGTTVDKLTPTLVPGLSSVQSIDAGYEYNFAIKTNGELWTWGNNSQGQLGIGNTLQQNSPVQVTALSNVVDVSAGVGHSAAVTSDGRVHTWGYNFYGQLGNGTTTDSDVPILVSGITDVVDVAVGLYHTLALKNDGTVWAWGYNFYGQIGNGTTTASITTPVRVGSIGEVEKAISVEAGQYHSMALLSTGQVLTWGYNGLGQLGDGTLVDRNTPGVVPGLAPVVKITAGGYHSTALSDNGEVHGWGFNSVGQLGDGMNTTQQLTPVTATGVNDAVDIGAGTFHGIIHRGGGTDCCSGYNIYGQLGDGSTADKNVYTCLAQTFLRPGQADADLDQPHADIDQTFDGRLMLTPNPTDGEVMIELNNPDGRAVQLILSDLMGRELYRSPLLNSPNIALPLDIGTYTPGVYLVKALTPDGRIVSEKLVLR